MHHLAARFPTVVRQSAVRLGAALLCVLSMLSGATSCRAQFTRFQNYADDQGLDSLDVTTLAQEPGGSMLIGTQGGLFRFDGSAIVRYGENAGLPPNWIRQVATDPFGRTWVVARDGVFVSGAGGFTRLGGGHLFTDIEALHPLAFGPDRVAMIDGGILMAAPLSRAGPGAFVPLLGDRAARADPDLQTVGFVAADGTGGFLFNCGLALCQVHGGRLLSFGTGSGLPRERWASALPMPDGTLWVRSLNHLAWRRPQDRTFTVVDIPGNGSSVFAGGPESLALAADGRGGIYTQGETGLLRWSGQGWHAIPPHAGGLPSGPIQALLFDREGSLWAGTNATGVFRSIGLGDWEHWGVEDGLPGGVVWSAARLPNGRLWVATYGGSTGIGAGSITIPGSTCALAATGNGRLWLAPFGEDLLRYDPASAAIEHLPPVGIVRTALVDQRNRLWLSTRTGLVLIGDADAPIGTVKPELVLRHGVRQVASGPSGRIWAASQDGVSRMDADGRFRLVIAADQLPAQIDGLAFAPDGTLWLATGGFGVRRFRIDGDRGTELPPIERTVLGTQTVMFVFRDRRDWMWVGTDHGVSLFDGHTWRTIDSSSGPISNDMDAYGAFEDTDGSMWFSTARGLSHYLDPWRAPAAVMLHPVITGVSLDGRAMAPAPSFRIGSDVGSISIHFTDLDFAQGRGVGYRYRLVGIDHGWNDTTAQEVRYGSLPAGRLRFELIAVDSVHHSASATAGFDLRVQAAWWQRWWFVLACGVLAAASVASLWRLRVRLMLLQQRRLQAEHERLEAVVGIRTAEIEQARSDLQRLAMSDMLTGLPNRRAVMLALDQAVDGAHRGERSVAVLLCDIDHFKSINDQWGHQAGDYVLAGFASRLAAAIGAEEVAGRYGGEEFLLILRGDAGAADRARELLGAATEQPFHLAGADRKITASGGFAVLRTAETAVSLIARADMALYQAKQDGRDRITLECDETATSRRVELDRDLRLALAGGEFDLHFQPVVDLRRNVVTCCEALLRWNSPTRGQVPPSGFIPFAEQHNLMAEIDGWVLRTACRAAADWPAELRLSVNLSPANIHKPGLVELIADILAETGLSASRLELEVTETAMIHDVSAAACVLSGLRGLGLSIALDDFGTGYSSLSFLRTLPFDRIKIDRSFVHDLGDKAEAEAIIGGVIHLCAGMGVAVTAEGVETPRQVELLRRIGCHDLQGYRIARPLPAARLLTWIDAFEATRTQALETLG